MTKPITNAATGKVTFPKPSEKGIVEPEAGIYVFLPEDKVVELARWAKQDGFVATAESDKGKQMQTSRAIKSYVFLGIDMVAAKRKG